MFPEAMRRELMVLLSGEKWIKNEIVISLYV